MRIRNLQAFRERMKLRSKRLLNSQIKSLDEASSFMVINAKRLAPYKTGETINGIRKVKKSNSQYRVESTVPGRFKQNLWANQKAPFRTIRWEKGNRRFGIRPGTTGFYGTSPAHFKWTGTPRFFDRAAQLTQKKIKGVFVKNTSDALHFG